MTKLIFRVLVFVFISVGFRAVAFAQTPPSIEVVLSAEAASQGQTVFADVYIRDVVNIAGADIGIEVNETCLRIVSREDGDFLPSTGETGGFSPFDELTDSTVRFATTVTDRTKIQSGSGVFYRVEMEVLCESGAGDVNITYVQLAQLADPESESNDLNSLTVDNGGVSTVVTALAVQPGIAQASTPVATLVPLPTQAPTAAATATPTASGDESSDDDNNLITIVIIVAVVIILLLLVIIAFLLGRSSGSKSK